MSGSNGDRAASDAAIADILASIRRIVADGGETGADAAVDVFELTPAMMLSAGSASARGPAEPPDTPAARMDRFAQLPDEDAEASRSAPPPKQTIDERTVADIVRRVLREEFAGAFGQNLTRQIRALIEKEIARSGTPPQP